MRCAGRVAFHIQRTLVEERNYAATSGGAEGPSGPIYLLERSSTLVWILPILCGFTLYAVDVVFRAGEKSAAGQGHVSQPHWVILWAARDRLLERFATTFIVAHSDDSLLLLGLRPVEATAIQVLRWTNKTSKTSS